MIVKAGSVANFEESLRQRISRGFGLAALLVNIVLVATLLAPTARAQESDSKPVNTGSSGGSAAGGKAASKRTTINFEDQLIEGQRTKPELFVLLQNRMNNSRRLFKLRENFLPEMRKTAEDVVRSDAAARGTTETPQ